MAQTASTQPVAATPPAPTADDYAKALMDMDCATCESGVSSLRGFSLATPSAAAPASRPAPAAATAASAPMSAAPRRSAPLVASVTKPAARTVAAPRPTAGDLMITFKRGAAELSDEGMANARMFASALKDPRLASLSFMIVGHTDATGAADRNVMLSEQRAEAVKKVLVDQGVEGGRLQTKGVGSQQLADPSAPGAAANRRVEAKRIG